MTGMTDFDPITGARVPVEQRAPQPAAAPLGYFAVKARSAHTTSVTLAAISFLINPLLILSILAIVVGVHARTHEDSSRLAGEPEHTPVGTGSILAGAISTVLSIVIIWVALHQ